MTDSKENKEDNQKKTNLYYQVKQFIFSKISKRYIGFVMISSCVWAFIKLSKEYNTVKVFHFKVEDMPSSGFIIKKTSYPIELIVKGTGFSLLSYNLFQSQIPINFKTQVNQNKKEFFINPNELIKYLRVQLRNNGLTLIEIPNRSIKLDLNIAKTKKVPIVADIQIDFKEGFGILDSIQFKPRYTILTGSEEDLKKISSIQTIPIQLNKVSKSFKLNKSLINPLPENQVKLSTISIEIEGKVNKFTQKILEVPIEVLNVPKNFKLSFFPEFVKLSFNLPLEKYDEVSNKDFKVVCLFDKLNKEDSFMIPKITKKPKFVKDLDMHEKRIEFIIKQ